MLEALEPGAQVTHHRRRGAGLPGGVADQLQQVRLPRPEGGVQVQEARVTDGGALGDRATEPLQYPPCAFGLTELLYVPLGLGRRAHLLHLLQVAGGVPVKQGLELRRVSHSARNWCVKRQ